MTMVDTTKKTRKIGKDQSERLEKNKKRVETWNEYFRENNNRFWDFTKFVCATSLSGSDIAILNTIQKPTVQFNILEAMVSRLRTEFSLQEPSINVRAADGVPVQMLTEEFLATEEIVESYLRSIFNDASNDNLQANINSEQLIGGFSAAWVRTEYVNERSFEQKIVVDKVFDPTMTFFDPMARTSHKGDGAYCGMLIPYTKPRFEEEFGPGMAAGIEFMPSSTLGGFRWSYSNEVEDIVLVAHMFEKKIKRTKIVMLANGLVIPKEEYEEGLASWDSIEQPPIVLDERWSDFEVIEQVKFIEDKEIYRGSTDYRYLPIVFIDGNSVLIKGSANLGASYAASGGASGAVQQMTRPYVYHARDAQRTMNLSGQTMANELENMVMHKWVASVEGVPTDYQDAYANPQEAGVLLYNAFDDKTGERLEPPREVQRTPTPPIVESSFMNAQSVIQATLGSYDASQGIVGDNLSGKAIAQGALQSSTASGVFNLNYLKAWDRLGQIVMDLIPKYYKTPRSLPVIGRDGKRGFRMVNNPEAQDNVDLKYDSSMLQLKVEAGVNSAIQKQMSLDMIIKLAQSSEIFSQFINTKGLSVLLDNMQVRNIDVLKAKAEEFEEEQRAQAEAMADQPSPEEMQLQAITQVEMAKVEQRAEEASGKLAIDSAKVAIDEQKVAIQEALAIAEIQEMGAKLELENEKVNAEQARSAIDLAISLAESHAKIAEVKTDMEDD